MRLRKDLRMEMEIFVFISTQEYAIKLREFVHHPHVFHSVHCDKFDAINQTELN